VDPGVLQVSIFSPLCLGFQLIEGRIHSEVNSIQRTQSMCHRHERSLVLSLILSAPVGDGLGRLRTN